jgi:16S rRNA G966 N2-methylase RsmD
MNTTTTRPTPATTPLAVLCGAPKTPSDREILDLFAGSGLTVEVVDRCSDLTCQWCVAAEIAA